MKIQTFKSAPYRDYVAVVRKMQEHKPAMLRERFRYEGEREEAFVNRAYRTGLLRMYAFAALLDQLVYEADDQIRRTEADHPEAGPLRERFMHYYEVYTDRLNRSTFLSEDTLADFKYGFIQRAKKNTERFTASVLARTMRLERKHPVTAARILATTLLSDTAASVWRVATEPLGDIKIPTWVGSALDFLSLMCRTGGRLLDIYMPDVRGHYSAEAGPEVERDLLALLDDVLDNGLVEQALEQSFAENGLAPIRSKEETINP